MTYANIPHFRHVNGYFTYTIPSPGTVDLKVYTEQEQLITTLVNHEQQSSGTHTYNYSADIPINDESHPPTVIVRFYLNGELLAERKHQLSQR